MPNSKSKKDLEDLINRYNERKIELMDQISRATSEIKDLDSAIDKAYKELNGQTNLFEGLM